MELVGGGELFDFIPAHNNFQEMNAAVDMRDLLVSFKYLPALNIVQSVIKLGSLNCERRSCPLRFKLEDFRLLVSVQVPGDLALCIRWYSLLTRTIVAQ